MLSRLSTAARAREPESMAQSKFKSTAQHQIEQGVTGASPKVADPGLVLYEEQEKKDTSSRSSPNSTNSSTIFWKSPYILRSNAFQLSGYPSLSPKLTGKN